MSSDDNKSEWYVQLVSGASSEIYRSNVISEFRTHLSPHLPLRGEWEVSVINCAYHKNWVNITEKEEVSLVLSTGTWRASNPPSLDITAEYRTNLPYPGNYSDTELLIDQINNIQFMKDLEGKPVRFNDFAGVFIRVLGVRQ